MFTAGQLTTLMVFGICFLGTIVVAAVLAWKVRRGGGVWRRDPLDLSGVPRIQSRPSRLPTSLLPPPPPRSGGELDNSDFFDRMADAQRRHIDEIWQEITSTHEVEVSHHPPAEGVTTEEVLQQADPAREPLIAGASTGSTTLFDRVAGLVEEIGRDREAASKRVAEKPKESDDDPLGWNARLEQRENRRPRNIKLRAR